MILWPVTNSEVLGARVLVLSVAGSEARGVSRVPGIHDGISLGIHSRHASLREAHEGVGPGR